jgi:hypothetical protein
MDAKAITASRNTSLRENMFIQHLLLSSLRRTFFQSGREPRNANTHALACVP